jgi:NADH-quinone oxidoreductase subunit N
MLALAIAMFMLSLAGIPPLFGFWPKLMVFQAAVEAGLLWLAIAAAVLTVVGAYYYIKVLKIMYFDPPAEPFAPARGRTETALIATCAVIISPLGYLLINPLTTAAANAASVF